MSNSSKKKQFGMNIGSASILLVFVILCLVSFSVLSIVSANADSKLSGRVLERTTAYYNACNQAEQSLAGMDKTLQRWPPLPPALRLSVPLKPSAITAAMWRVLPRSTAP